MNQFVVSYAQNREDIILEGFFPGEKDGFYVDIGAYDPDYDSVTKLFYEKGWRGINIEPQPDRYQYFVEKRTRDTNLNLGVGNKKTKLTLRSYANQGLSTFSDSMKSEYEHHATNQTENYKDIAVNVVPLKEVFRENKVASIQFLKVDVEGFEYEVLESNDWEKFRPEVLCIEANHIVKDWRPLLKEAKYDFVFSDGLNDYYADSRTDRGKKFNYVESVVFREPIVHFKLIETFNEYEKAITWLKDSMKQASDQAEVEKQMLVNEINALQHSLNEVTPFRRHLVKQVKRRLKKVDTKIVQKLSTSKRHVPPAASSTQSATSLEKVLEEAHSNDVKNLEQYQALAPAHPLLPVYEKAKNSAYMMSRKAIKKIVKS